MTITASYSTGAPTATADAEDGTARRGGLVGFGSPTVTASYWDIASSEIDDDTGEMGTSTAILQTPTSTSTPADNIYATWDDVDIDDDGTDDAPWDFGKSYQYPVLKYGDLDVEKQRPTVTLVPGRRPRFRRRTARPQLTATQDRDGQPRHYVLTIFGVS